MDPILCSSVRLATANGTGHDGKKVRQVVQGHERKQRGGGRHVRGDGNKRGPGRGSQGEGQGSLARVLNIKACSTILDNFLFGV